MNEASLVKLCLPEPPTPTSKAFPPGVRIILDTYNDNRKRKRNENYQYNIKPCNYGSFGGLVRGVTAGDLSESRQYLDQMYHSILKEDHVHASTPNSLVVLGEEHVQTFL